jgi:hypothetical protein
MSVATEGDYQFAPEERPAFPGSPFSPAHHPYRRLAFGAAGLVCGIGSTFGNALVTVNTANLAGDLGVYVVTASVLPGIYVAMNATAALTLVRGRQQFGIPAVTHGLLLAYAISGIIQYFVPGLSTAILVRAVAGLCASALVTMGLYYLMQAFPARYRPLSLLFGISLPQLGTPLARLVPVDLLSLQHWRGLHLIETGVALGILGICLALPLPRNERSKAFAPLDLATILLFIPAMLIVCVVLSVGRFVWWTDTPWLGLALAGAVPLFAAATIIELSRKDPLLHLRWIGTREMLRFAIVAILVRVALAEQTYGSVGLLTSGGLNNDQLHTLFVLVALSMVAGMIVAALTLKESRIRAQVICAALIIALGAWMDTDATNVTRPHQLYISQMLIGFGTTLFIGPGLVFGFIRVLRRGGDVFLTFLTMFSITQNVGGLGGSALLGTYQIARQKAHAAALSEHVIAADPQVAARIQSGTGALASTITDPGAMAAQGGGLLGQALNREATILAYNDVAMLVVEIALATVLYLVYVSIYGAVQQRRLAAAGAKP